MSGEQIIKSIKISINAYFLKREIDVFKIANKMYSLFKNLLNDLQNFNSNKTLTYSVYTFFNQSICPIAFNILYTAIENYDQYDENTLSQRVYFHNILNFPDEMPLLKKHILDVESVIQSTNEVSNCDKSFYTKLKSIHKKINLKFRIEETSIIPGDYYYYSINSDRNNDKVQIK